MFHPSSICLRQLEQALRPRNQSALFRHVFPSRPIFPHVRPFSVHLPRTGNPSMQCIRHPQSRILSLVQLRHYSPRPRRPVDTSFPQFTPPPLKPITQNVAFWGCLGFVGLLIWSPIPGWILLSGIAYGFFRLFRFIKNAQDAVFGPRSGILSTDGHGSSILDSIFSRDPRTREVAAKIQELAMERVELALEANEEGIQRLFPIRDSETSGEFHFTFPTEVSMVNAKEEILDKDIVDVAFEVRIKFMVYLATDGGRKGAEIVARADVIDEGVRLSSVDIREVKGGRRVRLKGSGVIEGEQGAPEDVSGVGKGEGEGKVIDATNWTSK